MLILLLGCLRPPGDSSPVGFYEGPTTIDQVSWSCELDAAEWRLEVFTLGWTSSGLFSISEGGLRVEAHELLSVEADALGAWDRLALTLAQVADPQDVEPGRSSAYVCDAGELERLSFRLVVFDPDTGDKADCRVWGQDLDWTAAAGYSACDQRLE